MRLSRLQERFRSYWGIEPSRIQKVGQIAREKEVDAVVVVGLNVLPYLGAVEGPLQVWYAADEWAWHHLSQVQLLRPTTWSEVRPALLKGLYERAFRKRLDRVWVVTEADRRAMHWVAGVHHIDLIPNGVDAQYFALRELPQKEHSCVFWGRLDFGPNVQGLDWFCRHVWPQVRQRVPDASFTLYGFHPTPQVQTLAQLPGICLIPDLPDLREEVARHQVVVLPFISGGGIKNKLLEAASMEKAIVCSPRACLGLRGGKSLPFTLAVRPRDWIEGLVALWSDPARRRAQGIQARQWVMTEHTWETAADTAVRGLKDSLRERNTR